MERSVGVYQRVALLIWIIYCQLKHTIAPCIRDGGRVACLSDRVLECTVMENTALMIVKQSKTTVSEKTMFSLQLEGIKAYALHARIPRAEQHPPLIYAYYATHTIYTRDARGYICRLRTLSYLRAYFSIQKYAESINWRKREKSASREIRQKKKEKKKKSTISQS